MTDDFYPPLAFPLIYFRGSLPLCVRNRDLIIIFQKRYILEQSKIPNTPILGMVYSLFPINSPAPYPLDVVIKTEITATLKYGLITDLKTIQKAEKVHKHLVKIHETSHIFELPFEITYPIPSKITHKMTHPDLSLSEHDYSHRS